VLCATAAYWTQYWPTGATPPYTEPLHEFDAALVTMLVMLSASSLLYILKHILSVIENCRGEESAKNKLTERKVISLSCEFRISDLRHEVIKAIGCQAGGTIAAASLAVMFTCNYTGWDSIVLNRYVVSAALLSAGLGCGAVSRLLEREFVCREEHYNAVGKTPRRRWTRPSLASMKEMFAIIGIIFALYSGKLATVTLARNARANTAATRGQLYQASARVISREATSFELVGLYSRPDMGNLANLSDYEVGRKYWRSRLLITLKELEPELLQYAIAHPEILHELDLVGLSAKKGELTELDFRAIREEISEHLTRIVYNRCGTMLGLYNFIYPKNVISDLSADPIIKFQLSANDNEGVPRSAAWVSDSFIERRCREVLSLHSSHMSDVFDLVHCAFDYRQDGILTAEEYETWAAFITDTGAHPVLVATFWNWLDQGYMSIDFFHDINARFQETDREKEEFPVACAWDVFLRVELRSVYQERVRDLESYRMPFYRSIRPKTVDLRGRTADLQNSGTLY
jgi:hypothetical protein